jgi:4-amino-4-deoxy-L-arabinose transferase-like glycosyltransferase
VTTAVAEAVPDRRALERQRASSEGWLLRQAWIIVGALVGIGLVLRLLQSRGIWVDEAISIHQAHMSLSGLLSNLRQTDNHPPLYFLTLWATVRALGYSTVAVRAPSIAAGTLLIPAMFLAGRELFDRRSGLFAALLASIAPLVIWYSQEARPYEMFALFATLAVWAQARALNDRRARYWVAWGALTIAQLYTHYFSTIPIAIQQLAFAGVVWGRARRGEAVRPLLVPYWVMWAAIVVAIAPLVPFVHEQFVHNQSSSNNFSAPSAGAATASAPQQGHPNVYALIANFVWALWGYHANSTMVRIAALWPLLMLLGLAVLGRGRGRGATLVLALGLVPALLLMAAGYKSRALFEVRYFSGAVPMLILICARGALTCSTRRLPVLLAAGALTATMIAGTVDQQLNKNNPRDYDFRSALEAVNSRIRPGDTLLYAPNYLQDEVQYYSPGARARVAGAKHVPRRGRVFLLASFLDTGGVAGQVGAVKDALIHYRGRPILTDRLQKIDVWEFR